MDRKSSREPPAYSPVDNSSSVPSPLQTGQDDQYAFLKSFDTIFLIDDSASMSGALWHETRDAIETITPVCTQHDDNGIDIYFLNHPDRPEHHNVKKPADVRRIFDTVIPGGATPTGQRLNSIFRPYLRDFEARPNTVKPINIIVITDGEATDDVESPLIRTAQKLDKLDAPAWQIGVQFFQVGGDERAKKHLRELDDNLGEIAGDDELRDIVDTVPFTGERGGRLTGDGILKVVVGAINRRYDRKRSGEYNHY